MSRTSGSRERRDSLRETEFWLQQLGIRADVAAARAETEAESTTSGRDLRLEFGLSE